MYRLHMAGLAAILMLVIVASASAAQRSAETFTFADPYSSSGDCGTFALAILGHDEGRVTTWFDAAGNPIMQIGHIKAWETDTNTSTGKTIYVTTNLMVHIDFVAGTITLTGKRNMSNVPGEGAVVQHVGRVVIGPDGQPVSLSGKYADFETAYMGQDYCDAVA